MTNTLFRNMDSLVGPLTIAGDGETVTNLRMADQSHPPSGQSDWREDPRCFEAVVVQLEEYFAGERTIFDLAMRLEGTAFQRAVWRALTEIPYGETCSYGEVAHRVGRPGAARAVGVANGHNPVGIIVPCHRVIGASGALVGYGGGVQRKQVLLQLEQSTRFADLSR
jgi:methylated-DNA-[protein]-cysteine S-methyltransferase